MRVGGAKIKWGRIFPCILLITYAVIENFIHSLHLLLTLFSVITQIRVQDDDSNVRGFSNPHYENQPPDAETSEGARTKTDSQSEGTTA